MSYRDRGTNDGGAKEYVVADDPKLLYLRNQPGGITRICSYGLVLKTYTNYGKACADLEVFLKFIGGKPGLLAFKNEVIEELDQRSQSRRTNEWMTGTTTSPASET